MDVEDADDLLETVSKGTVRMSTKQVYCFANFCMDGLLDQMLLFLSCIDALFRSSSIFLGC